MAVGLAVALAAAVVVVVDDDDDDVDDVVVVVVVVVAVAVAVAVAVGAAAGGVATYCAPCLFVQKLKPRIYSTFWTAICQRCKAQRLQTAETPRTERDAPGVLTTAVVQASV